MNDPALQIVLAPLRGLTESLFRNSYAEHFGGVDWAVTPFLNTMGDGRIKPSQLREVLTENNGRMPVVPQVIGSAAEPFIALCNALADLGYATVNWNLGCPFPRVAKKGRGSGMLAHPDRIDRFLDEVLGTIRCRLSIKMRLGRHHPDEIFRLLPVLDRYPLEQIILHPRTGVQMYDGQPDRDLFATCLGLTRHSLIYNGDITSVADMERLRRRFPTLGTWMIGRGIIADPFLPERIKGLTGTGLGAVERFRRFHDSLFQGFSQILMGPAHVVDRMKGYWTYFACFFNDGRAVLKKIRKCRTAESYTAVVQRFWEGAEQAKDNRSVVQT